MPDADVVLRRRPRHVARAITSGSPCSWSPDDGDQRENALRVAYSGAGLRLPRRWTSAESLRLAVRRLIADDRYIAKAREIAAWNVANPDTARAAELIEELVASKSPRPSLDGNPRGIARASAPPRPAPGRTDQSLAASPPRTPRTTKRPDRAVFGESVRGANLHWEGGTRTRNPSINSRMLCH